MTESPLRNYAEAAEYLRLSASELRRRVSRGEVATVRFGRKVWFTEADLDAFIERQRVTASTPTALPSTSAPRRHLRSLSAQPNLGAIRKAAR